MFHTRLVIRQVLVLGWLMVAGQVPAEDCAPQWAPEGALPGLTNPHISDETVRALVVFDDGTGPALYAGGLFSHAGDVVVNGIARWDGSSWSPVDGGVTEGGGVYSMLVWDDGSGSALYVGGYFEQAGGVAASNVAKWDGDGWSALGLGLRGGAPHTIVYALAVLDDGSGPALYAGGRFIESLNIRTRGVAKWNGRSWESTGSQMDDKVNALAVFNDGAGPALYAGGLFSTAGGVAAAGIAKWDGTSWSEVGGGVGGTYPHVRALTVHDDGTGKTLHVGGQFVSAGTVAALRVARWDGSTWATLGSGFGAWVTSLRVFDDGTGPTLYAGGKFSASGETSTPYVARWAPQLASWNTLDGGMNDNVYVLGVFDDGNGPDLYVGGRFTSAGETSANSGARWDGCLTLPANLDADDDLDLDDLGRLVPCLTGPGAGILLGCDRGDTDQDDDVDLLDYAVFQTAVTE